VILTAIPAEHAQALLSRWHRSPRRQPNRQARPQRCPVGARSRVAGVLTLLFALACAFCRLLPGTPTAAPTTESPSRDSPGPTARPPAPTPMPSVGSAPSYAPSRATPSMCDARRLSDAAHWCAPPRAAPAVVPTAVSTVPVVAQVTILPNRTTPITVNVQSSSDAGTAAVTVPANVCPTPPCTVRVEAVTAASGGVPVSTPPPAGLVAVAGAASVVITVDGRGGPLSAAVSTRAHARLARSCGRQRCSSPGADSRRVRVPVARDRSR
jgi:hypothetical protein